MNAGELKPILAALVLPPAGPLLLVALGCLLLMRRRRPAGALMASLGTLGLWLLSCQAVAVWLTAALLPPVTALDTSRLASAQAVVVLGGGVLREAPEYGQAQPSSSTYGRLRYGAHLARTASKPLAFAGGVGWASADSGFPSEAEVAAHALRQDFGLALRWSDARSRDTQENAHEMRRLLGGIDRIALVTDAWHMPRAARAFERAGFAVMPAPTGFAASTTRPLLQWLPSTEGLTLSRQVLREWLALRAAG